VDITNGKKNAWAILNSDQIGVRGATQVTEPYKRLRAESEPDVRESYQKVQRAWMAYRDARCNHPPIELKGSMAGPMQAWCLFHLTADQALWLEGRLQFGYMAETQTLTRRRSIVTGLAFLLDDHPCG
jgi:Lysozyme inhibitor LprI